MSEPVVGIEGHGLKVTITDQGASGGLTTTPADPAGINLDPDSKLKNTDLDPDLKKTRSGSNK